MDSYQMKEELALNLQTQISLMEVLGSHMLSSGVFVSLSSHELLLHFLGVFYEPHFSRLAQILSPCKGLPMGLVSSGSPNPSCPDL